MTRWPGSSPAAPFVDRFLPFIEQSCIARVCL